MVYAVRYCINHYIFAICSKKRYEMWILLFHGHFSNDTENENKSNPNINFKLMYMKQSMKSKGFERRLLLIMWGLFLSLSAFAQQISIKGHVVDATGEPVIGASVVEKGTTNGIVTDVDGKFTLSVKPGAILKISFVGYQPQEVKATPTMKIVLKEDTELLDEVVVVGYGTQKKANLTGAVTTVDLNKTMSGRPQQDVTKALQGAVPGLSITTENGDINGSAAMRIRGVGTLSNSEKSNPLIVVDGVPMDDISFLNTQDIESISVLKDAASTSIYGTRAAFGVILINTKSAKPTEKVTINYSNNFAWDQATYLPNFPDVPTQLRAALEAKANANQYEVELFGMYFDKLLPYAEKWAQQNGGRKLKYGEMRPYQSIIMQTGMCRIFIIVKQPLHKAIIYLFREVLVRRTITFLLVMMRKKVL